MVFFDWLTVRQEHDGLPVWGRDLVRTFDLENGDQGGEWVTGREVEGSWSSSLRIRSDGRSVEVSGNPSRWCKRDNVFGLSDIEQALDVFNAVLADVGLPVFSVLEPDGVQQYQSGAGSAVWQRGARLTRVDLARNWTVGAGAEPAFIRWAGTQAHRGQAGHVYADGSTVDWNRGSRRTYFKLYVKGCELRRERCKGELAAWRLQLADWCDSVGLVRHELTVRGVQLMRLGLASPGSWSQDVASELLERYAVHERPGSGSAMVSEVLSVADRLIDAGIKPRRARHLELLWQSWASGYDLRRRLGRSQWYAARADLLLAGFDLATPLNVTAMRVPVRSVTLAPAVAPDWYVDAA